MCDSQAAASHPQPEALPPRGRNHCPLQTTYDKEHPPGEKHERADSIPSLLTSITLSFDPPIADDRNPSFLPECDLDRDKLASALKRSPDLPLARFSPLSLSHLPLSLPKRTPHITCPPFCGVNCAAQAWLEPCLHHRFQHQLQKQADNLYLVTYFQFLNSIIDHILSLLGLARHPVRPAPLTGRRLDRLRQIPPALLLPQAAF